MNITSALAADPSRSVEFGPWHLADRVALPPKATSRAAGPRMPLRSAIACFNQGQPVIARRFAPRRNRAAAL